MSKSALIMLIERPLLPYRILLPGALWRVKPEGPGAAVYLTFDDGPIPEVTPWVLDRLDDVGAHATFFMVGENARRHPQLVAQVLARGHAIGNHTMHHLQGLYTAQQTFIDDVAQAARHIPSTLFRPPHGIMLPGQLRTLARQYRIVMHDLVTRDYSRRLTPEQVLHNVKHYTRPGSIIVFHDSLKAWPRLEYALPRALQWLKNQGYEFRSIPS